MVSLWALEKTGTRKDATDWLNKQISNKPEDRILLWCKDYYEMNKRSALPENDKESSSRILDHLIAISN